MVVAVAACTFVMYAVLYSILGSTDFKNLYYIDSYTNKLVWAPGSDAKLWSLVVPMLAIGSVYLIVSLVAGWVFCATAISGLRNRPFTVSDLINRGLRTIAAGIVIGAVVVGAMLALIVFTVVTFGIGSLLFFVAIPAGVYMAIRISFLSLAIFDGFGPIDGIKESWRLSKGSVLRMFGWGLMAGLIGLVFSFAAGFISLPLSLAGAQAVGQALSTAIAMTAACFTVFMMAVLYESERARKNPAAYGLTPTPYPYAPGPYATGPYAAGPYAAGPNPYAQGPYPQGPYPSASPTWPANQGPANLPYQGATPGYPGSQPPRWGPPNAPQAWPGSTPTDPAATPPTGSAPTDPPTAG
jgi:hypothetical protein